MPLDSPLFRNNFRNHRLNATLVDHFDSPRAHRQGYPTPQARYPIGLSRDIDIKPPFSAAMRMGDLMANA
jgi:hypothetical protein